jgi:ankyrin repeat protein
MATSESAFRELARAVRDCDTVTVTRLLSEGVDPDAFPYNAYGDSLLMRAVDVGAGLDIIGLLIDHGAALTTTSSRAETVGSVAVKKGRSDVIELLKSRGVAVDDRPFASLAQDEKDERLHRALRDDWTDDDIVERVSRMLDDGADPDAPVDDRPPLLVLAKQGTSSAPLYQVLLSHGADPAAATARGNTTLHVLAKYGGNVAVAASLLDAGAPVDAPNAKGCTPLHLAAASGHTGADGFVEWLLAAGADAAATDRRGRTPADRASGRRKKVLLAAIGPGAAPADLALIEAVVSSRLAEVRTLVESGASPLALDTGDREYGPNHVEGITALHAAFQRGVAPAVADYLLSVPGLDWNVRDIDGRTPLHVVLDQWQGPVRADFAQRLLAAGADPNVADARGETPLWRLLSFYELDGEIELIEALVSGGAEPGHQNRGGETILDAICGELQYFHETHDKAGFVRLAQHLSVSGYPGSELSRRGLTSWLAAKAPKYLDGAQPAPVPPTAGRQRFAQVTAGVLEPLLMTYAYLSIEGQAQPVALFDWFALGDDEDNDESDLASQVWEYHIPTGPVTERVEREEWAPFGIVGMTGSMDSFEEMGVDGTLFLDLTGAGDGDAPVVYIQAEAPDGEGTILGTFDALMGTLTRNR